MNRQFWDGIKVKDVIDKLRPKLILEVGFGAGTNIMNLLAYRMKAGNGYNVISLSSSGEYLRMSIPNDVVKNFVYVHGISYDKIRDWKLIGLPAGFNVPVDLCIIDSDHNYYTLKREFEHLDSIMSDKCVIAVHDTASKPCSHHLEYEYALCKESNCSYQTTLDYSNGTLYPKEEILKTLNVPLMRAIDEFLAAHPAYKKTIHLDECCGCTVLTRNFDYALLEAAVA